MAMQSLFARAVNSSLPTAIPTTLERIDQFAIGKVLTYQKKPRKLLPWRRHELNFTGRSITDLLVEGQQLNFATSSDFLFDAGKGTDKISVEVRCKNYVATRSTTLFTHEPCVSLFFVFVDWFGRRAQGCAVEARPQAAREGGERPLHFDRFWQDHTCPNRSL